MAVCVEISSEGFIYQAAIQEPCSALSLLTADEFQKMQGMNELWEPDFEFTSFVLGSCLLMFAIGAGIGMILNQVRKAR